MTLIYIDGANVAHENHEKIFAARIETAQNDLEKSGFKSHALLLKYKVKKMKDPEIIKQLVKENRLTFVSIDDDEYLIDLAIENDAFILTNDGFKDYKKKEWWSPKIEEGLIKYCFVEGHLSITRSTRHRLDSHLRNSSTE